MEIFSWPPGQLYFSYVFMSRQSLDSWIRGRGLDPLAGMTHTPCELLVVFVKTVHVLFFLCTGRSMLLSFCRVSLIQRFFQDNINFNVGCGPATAAYGRNIIF